jgi:hypothetical protein
MYVRVQKRHDELADQNIDCDRLDLDVEHESGDRTNIVVEHDTTLGEVRIAVDDEIVWSGVGFE